MADDRALPRDSLERDGGIAPSPRARGRPVGDREARRAEILKAAIAVIAEEGFAGASLRSVARRAGCTTGAVTYNFANKEAMMAAVIESRFDEYDAMLGSPERPVDIKAGFERSFDFIRSDETGGWVAAFQLLAHARHDPVLAEVYVRRYGSYRDALAKVVAAGQQQGVIRRDIAADLLTDQLSAMADGWLMLIPIERERFRPERLKALAEATVALFAPPSRQ